MKINLIILFVIFAFLGGWALYTKQTQPQFEIEDKKVTSDIEYSTAANFDYTDINGKTASLIDHKGRAVLLHFWATWCAPCLVEFPELIKLAQRNPGKITIIAVSSDQNKKNIEQFLKRIKAPTLNNLIIVHDSDNGITQDLYQTYKLPETYLISPSAKIVQKYIGPQELWGSDSFMQELNNLPQ